MTAGKRGRVARLEARRREDAGDMVGIFEADLGAGVWREMNGAGRTIPLSPDDLREAGAAHAAGGGLLIVAPVGCKVIPGVQWGDI